MTAAIPATLADIIRDNATEQPDMTMLKLGDTSTTFGDVHRRAGQVSHGLAGVGLGVGDRVAFLDKNSIEYFEVLFGSSLMNAVTVSINNRLAAPEMAYVVNDSAATILIIHTDFAEQLAAMRGQLTSIETIVVIGDTDLVTHDDIPYESWLDSRPTDDPGVVAEPGDVAIQLYTSGTTGHPKGAQLTNYNFSSLLAVAAKWAMSKDSVNLVAMPLFHIGGTGWALFGMANGCASVIMRDVDPMILFKLIEDERLTHAFLVPVALQFMLLLDAEEHDLSSMELIVYGASPITEEVLVGSMAQFNCEFMQVYGLTETTGAVTQLLPEDHDPGGPRANLLRSAGSPMAGVELKIVDEDSGVELPDGEVGEIWVKSPSNMAGYWNLPDATAEALPGDGWFRSGDAAYMEDGFLFIHDRVKDMIVSGGENVYPAEIENALMSHDSIADVGVIGVPHDKWGETPKALVVLAEDCELDEAALIAHCKTLLAGFKCPTSIETIEALPRNPSGKILKRELRAPYWEGRDRKV